MKFEVHESTTHTSAEITELDHVIDSEQAFLDIIVNIPHDRILFREEMFIPAFFDLKTGLAGAILQKVSLYRLKIGIIGDYSKYSSKSLRDFIYESNRQGQVIFHADKSEILEKLAL